MTGNGLRMKKSISIILGNSLQSYQERYLSKNLDSSCNSNFKIRIRFYGIIFFNSQENCKILYILEKTEKVPLNIAFKNSKIIK